jgi:hypothetical protein
MPVDLSTLHTLLNVAGKPAYVKAAAEQVHHGGVDARGCADGFGHQYPCTDRESTYVSALKIAAAEADGVDVTDAKAGLMKFARFWQIEDDVEAALTKVAAHFAEEPIPEDAYALDVEVNGQRLRKFAAYSPMTTVAAATAFYDNRFRYPLEWRQKTAAALIKKAKEYGVEIPQLTRNYLYRAAGLGFPTKTAMEDGLIERLNRLPPNRKVAAEKLASAIGAIADSPHLRYNHDLVRDVLTLTDRFDREMKLAAHYESGEIGLPEEMLELTTEMVKHAGEIERGGLVNLQNGQEVNVHHLSKSALEIVDPALAKMSAERLSRVLPTLPAPDADILCKAAGVKKSAKPTSRPGLPPAPRVEVVPPSKGTEPIGKPKVAQAAMPGMDPMMDPMMAGGDPMAGGAPMPGPGAIPGAPTPGEGAAPIDAPGQAEAAPNLPMTPGQAEKPTPAPAAGAMDPGAAAGMEPGAAPLDILDDPNIVESASPTGDMSGGTAAFAAGGGTDSSPGSTPALGTPMGANAQAAKAVLPDTVSGMPQAV